jgi:hypothetical protein
MGARSMRWLAVFTALALPAQIIDFESNGLHFKTQTKNGLTVMFAPIGSHVKDYSILQVAVSNGSKAVWTVRPEDFSYYRDDRSAILASSALTVVTSLMNKASRHDVIKLVSTYEAGIYGNSRLQSSNGYEIRRQNAMAEFGSARLKAAAAASAIALVSTRLNPGQSTDGAVFFSTNGKPLGPGKLVVHAAAEDFEFPSDGQQPAK